MSSLLSLHAVSTCSWASPNSHWHTATPHPAPVSSPCRALPQGLPCYRLGFSVLAGPASANYVPLRIACELLRANSHLGLAHVLSSQPSQAPGPHTKLSQESCPQTVQPFPKAEGLRAASFHSSPTEFFISGKDYALQTTLDYSSNH